MSLFLYELTTWEEVATLAARKEINTCIRQNGSDLGMNHDKAQATWQEHYPKAIRYFAIMNGDKYESPEGYIRILTLTESDFTNPQVWGVDYARPLDYSVVAMLAAKLASQVLLVKRSESGSTKNISLAANWPVVTAAFPQLDRYTYKIQSARESAWLVVPVGKVG
jgi:hypothetical protein